MARRPPIMAAWPPSPTSPARRASRSPPSRASCRLAHARIPSAPRPPNGSAPPPPRSTSCPRHSGAAWPPIARACSGCWCPTWPTRTTRTSPAASRTAPARPAAFSAAPARLALAVIAAATDLHLRVPEELAVVGFDDLPLAPYVRPALTTVAQPARQLGDLAIQAALQLTAGLP